MTERASVLVVDAKEALLRSCRDALGAAFDVHTAPPGAALDELLRRAFDVVVGDRGVLEQIRPRARRAELVILEKPLDVTCLCDLVRSAADRRQAAEIRHSIESRFGMGAVVGTSEPMRPVFDAIARAADDDVPVVLVGERGTGKELIARTIHQSSARAGSLFVRVGGWRFRADRFRQVLAGDGNVADGGTLYVEELGDLPEPLRASLPAILEAGPPHRIVLATSAAELARGLSGGVHWIDVPPLRERAADVPLLAAHFVAKHAPRIAPSVERLGPAALDALVAHQWPGNVRELEAVIERALVASRGDAIERHHIAPEILAASIPSASSTDPTSVSFKEALALARERTSQQYIAALLRLCDGNVTRAADLAGLERESLHRLMRRYGIRSELFKPPKEGD
jgi:DNA-binding NtrC family response regulator